jgi:hypothetical protein
VIKVIGAGVTQGEEEEEEEEAGISLLQAAVR